MLICILTCNIVTFFFFSSRRRHTRCSRDWSSDVCSSDLVRGVVRQLRSKRKPRLHSFDSTQLPVSEELIGPVAPGPVMPPKRKVIGRVNEIGRASCRERV